MKKETKMILGCMTLGMVLIGVNQAVEATSQAPVVEMHRLYNKSTGEHFYTANVAEKNKLVATGWKYEGIGWYAPATGDKVYRLYNANTGDHHYTTNLEERNVLIDKGWINEGVGWYSDPHKTVPLYRAYNPNAKASSHNYTTNKLEQKYLVKLGWKDEGFAWYGIALGNVVEEEKPEESTEDTTEDFVVTEDSQTEVTK
ncbi:hypothetical protein M2139_000323 [Enterococcus sp. PF1-24]|uniref:hypothetical protein n=1 Tax=unclassified Enterococcus TaxID=2608891 RepID=UPI0024748870|nr:MULTISPECIES: hypothetical protein [unclassified Enterococcus]MDH6363257.1 hypothetical protein [Enterococcus sp. PFB1-1]MDH6400442.1 hypothetical protein [Enterococcus sp. PF1-24]